MEALLVPHTCFPFSHTVPSTRHAFCRAIILLTNRYKTVLGQGSSGPEGAILQHTIPRQRLFFIFSALSHAPTGEASYDDLLGVVSRISYPTIVDRFKHHRNHRPLPQLASLLQCLEAGKPATCRASSFACRSSEASRETNFSISFTEFGGRRADRLKLWRCS